jgi:hypothetical protein
MTVGDEGALTTLGGAEIGFGTAGALGGTAGAPAPGKLGGFGTPGADGGWSPAGGAGIAGGAGGASADAGTGFGGRLIMAVSRGVDERG